MVKMRSGENNSDNLQELILIYSSKIAVLTGLLDTALKELRQTTSVSLCSSQLIDLIRHVILFLGIL